MTAPAADDGARLDHLESGDPAGMPVVLLAGFKAPATS
jgi:non-heme chloroperoxidase